MSKRRIEVYEYRNIIYQLRKNIGVRTIARNSNISRNTVREIRDLASENNWLTTSVELPSDEVIYAVYKTGRSTTKKSTAADQYSHEITTWHEQGVNSTVIYRALKEAYGFTGSYQIIQRYIKNIKISEDITVPLYFAPGEYAQVDFGKGRNFYDVNRKRNVTAWFFVMTLCWSRHQYCEIVERQDIETWLNCHKRAFAWFGGVPKYVMIDNAACAIAKASYTEPEPTKSYLQFAEDYNFIISACPPYDPQKKGRVESGVKYVKNNFMPLRKPTSIEDENKDLKHWALSIAGNRIHGTTKQQPLKIFTEIEQALLTKLPENDVEICVWSKASIYRDCHIRYKSHKYSAPYKFVGKEVWVCCSESIVKIYYEHKLVATHARNPKNHEKTSTITEHLPPKAAAFLLHDGKWCLEKAVLIGPSCLEIVSDILNSKYIDLLRSAQQLIYLKDKYGDSRLETACARAIKFCSLRYGTVKNILKNGVDSNAITETDAFDNLAETVYGQNPKFYREITSIKN